MAKTFEPAEVPDKYKRIDDLQILNDVDKNSATDTMLAYKVKESVEINVRNRMVTFWDSKYTFDELIAIVEKIKRL